MLVYQPLDKIPILGVYLLTAVILMISIEAGYRLGNIFQKRWPDHSESGVNAMVGASLASLGFLLAFIASIAVNIFNGRMELVIQEADVIGTTYLRAGYLDQPISAKSRELLGEYVEVRLAAFDRNQLDAAIARSEEIHQELWGLAETIARNDPTPISALYIDSLNQLIDLHSVRINKELVIRVPPFFLLAIYLVAIFTMMLIGVYGSYAGKLNYLALFIMILIISTVFLIIVDLDRSHQGLITIPQNALIDLQKQIHLMP